MEFGIAKPLHLKCGLTLRNRLVKAAMAESLGDIATNSLPDSSILNVYRKWAKGEWGLVITGEARSAAECIMTKAHCVMKAEPGLIHREHR
jgi:2,4-dienoyl-CoA reductase-like NADH-dependent reductase (Old Yellow Enzyme family)